MPESNAAEAVTDRIAHSGTADIQCNAHRGAGEHYDLPVVHITCPAMAVLKAEQ